MDCFELSMIYFLNFSSFLLISIPPPKSSKNPLSSTIISKLLSCSYSIILLNYNNFKYQLNIKIFTYAISYLLYLLLIIIITFSYSY